MEPSTLPDVTELSDNDGVPPAQTQGAGPGAKPKPKKPKTKASPKPKAKAAQTAKPKAKPSKTDLKRPAAAMKRPCAKISEADAGAAESGGAAPDAAGGSSSPVHDEDGQPIKVRKAYLEFNRRTCVYSIRLKDHETGKKPEILRVGVAVKRLHLIRSQSHHLQIINKLPGR